MVFELCILEVRMRGCMFQIFAIRACNRHVLLEASSLISARYRIAA